MNENSQSETEKFNSFLGLSKMLSNDSSKISLSPSDLFTNQQNENDTNKKRDLENLLEKKFNLAKKIEDNMSGNNENKTFTINIDSNDDAELTVDQKMANDNYSNEEGRKNFKSYSSTNSESNEDNCQKNEDFELKILIEYIRSHSNFEFKNIDLNNNSKSEMDKEFAQCETENDENIKSLVEFCRQKFPELKHKVSKCVRSVFKEKFRASIRTKSNDEANFDSNSKLYKTSANNSNSSLSSLSNNSLKPQEINKSKLLNGSDLMHSLNSSNKITSVSPSSSSSSSSTSQKHLINSTDSKSSSSKKLKTSSSFSLQTNGTSSNEDDKINKVNENLKSPSRSVNSPSLPTSGLFNSQSFLNVSQSSSPIISSTSSSSPSTNPLASLASSMPLFDPDFLRLAAASNPLFRFPDFTTANNPYLASLSNLFRTNLANSASSFGLSQPSSTSFLTPTPPLPLSLNSSLTSASANSSPNSQLFASTSSSASASSKNPMSPTPKNTTQYSNNNHEKSLELSKNNSSKNVSTSSSNGSSKAQHNSLNGDAANKISSINGNLASSYFSSSSKLKLSSKFSKLSQSEIQTIKNLIIGYKESAAFLNRSAEELEQLINESYDAEQNF